MLVPLVLGYVVGAVGMYSFLANAAPVLAEEEATHPAVGYETEVIELFPAEEIRRAA
jgi:hypothetical protein